MTNNLLLLSSHIYSALLCLYPRDLRCEFGKDMTMVFAEDLAEAWRHAHMAGVVRVWSCTVIEVFRIALPNHARNPSVAVPVVLFALDLALGLLQLRSDVAFDLRLASASGVQGPLLIEVLKNTLLWPSIAAATAFVAVRPSESSAAVSLRFARH
jgi:hypothetical protein